MAAERWRPVPGWAGYEVSDLGRVRSVDRVLADGRRAGGVVLTPSAGSSGYLRVTLSDGEHRQTVAVHVLVLTAWKGPRRPGRDVRHLNGRRADNRPGNLAWGTKGRNELDKASHRQKLLSRSVSRLLRRL